MPARPSQVLVWWARRTGAVLAMAFAAASLLSAQSTQPVLMQSSSGVTIQITNVYNGMPTRGFLPLRVTITNSSNNDGQWEMETQALVGAGVDSHFSAQSTCAVQAHATRTFEVLAPLPDASAISNAPPRVNVHVTGPGVANPDVVFSSNVQQPPPSALRMQVPYNTGTTFGSSRGVIGGSRGSTSIVADGSGNTTRTTTTYQPDGSIMTEAIATRLDGSTLTVTTVTDPTGRVISRSSRATRPTGGSSSVSGSQPGALLSSSSSTATPVTITRNADGSITQTWVTPRPDGTTLTVKRTLRTDSTQDTSYTITNSAGSIIQSGPGDGPPTSKTGTGTFLLNGTTIYNGTTTVNAGTLNLGALTTKDNTLVISNSSGLLPSTASAPGDRVNTSYSTDPLTGATIRTTVTKHTDGATTTITATPGKMGTDIVTETVDATGAKKSTSHELQLSPQSMDLAVPSSVPASSLLPNASVHGSGSAVVSSGDSTYTSALRSVAAAMQGNTGNTSTANGSITLGNAKALGGSLTVGSGNMSVQLNTPFGNGSLNLSGGNTGTASVSVSTSGVFAQVVPGAAPAVASRPPPPPPPPPPPAATSSPAFISGPGSGSLTISGSGTITTSSRGVTIGSRGRGPATRMVTRAPGAPVFIGLSPTLAHDQGEKIKNYFLTACARPLQQSTLDPTLLSADWRAYLGFDLVFYTAADWLAAPPEVRTALAQWVAAGGEMRLIANEDGGLNLPPRLGEHYGAGAIELFSEDELNNYNFATERTDPKERALFSLEYHPVTALDTSLASASFNIPTGMQAREFSLSADILVRLVGMDPYTGTGAIPAAAGTSIPSMMATAETMLKQLFSNAGASFENGTSVRLNATTRQMAVINTPENLDRISNALTRYGVTSVATSGAGSVSSPGPQSPEMKKLSTILIPSVNIQVPMLLDQVVGVLHDLSMHFDPEGKGVKMQVFVPAGEDMPKVVLPGLNNLSIADILSIACKNAGYTYAAEGQIIALRKVGASSRPSASGDAAKTVGAKTESSNPKFADEMPHLGNRYFVVAMVIICFGLLAGPLNLFWFCHGSRRPHLLWVTPLLAIIASVAILGFILLAEGIGGRGVFFRVTQLNPDGKFAVESEVESSVTGLLTRHEFDLGEPAWVLDYNQADPNNPIWAHGNFLQVGKHYTGDWFASRREQMLFARAVVPSRSSLRADAGVDGQPPVLHSEHNGLMVNLFYVDGDGNYWKTDRITEGQPTHLQAATADEFAAAWNDHLRAAPELLAGYLRKITPQPGTFFALGNGEASALEPDFSGLRWNRFRHLITGPVAQ